MAILLLITQFSIFKKAELRAQNNIDSLKNSLLNAKTDSAKASISSCIGDYYLINNSSKALSYIEKSITLYKQIKDTTNLCYSMINLFDYYYNNGDYKQAIDILKQAENYSKNQVELSGLYYNRLALWYEYIGESEISVNNDKLALACYKKQKDSISISCALHNIGVYYIGIAKYDSAQFYLNKSKKFCIDSTDVMIASNQTLLSIIERHKKNYTLAIELNKSAIRKYAADSLWYDVAYENQKLAECYNEMNLTDSALITIKQAIYINKKYNFTESLKSNYNLIYRLYKKRREYRKALKYSDLEREYADSLAKKNKENIVQNYEIRDKLDKNKEILKQTKINNEYLNKQRTRLGIFSLIVFLLFLLAFYLLIQKRKEEKKNKELVLQLNGVNDTLRTILSIIGHDLKESIGSLKTFTEYMHLKILDKKSIDELIADFVPLVESSADLLDNLLTWSKNNNENFTPELNRICSQDIIERTLIHIRHIANAKQIEFSIEDEQIYFIADSNMINIVLRNLVTNAIKFSNNGSEITIKTSINNNYIEFSVIDHGVGMTEEQINHIFDKSKTSHTKGTNGENGSGIGLSLCKSFISKQNGKLSVYSTPGVGSTFKLSFPMESNKRY